MRSLLLEESVAYRDADTALNGVLVRPPGPALERAPVVILHGGAGLDDHARTQARRYATRGHAVLAADLYGPGVAGDRDRVLATIGELQGEPGRLARRVEAAVDTVADLSGSPVETITVIGFCFGGTAALELARTGRLVAGVVSVHGGLSTSRSATPVDIRARVLICHGGSDPHVPPDQVTTFLAEMTGASADWQLIVYGRAQHGFTHAHDDGSTPGVAFDPETDRRAYSAICDFLD